MRAGNLEHRNLPLLLLHAREAALAHFRPILKKFRLTDQQWRILRDLSAAPKPGMEAGQIADACQILSPSLTGILTRLEQMGLVRRQWSEVDQRRQIIQLTDQGDDLVSQVAPLIDAQYRRIETLLGTQTLAEIYQSIDRVASLLGQPMPSALDDEDSVAPVTKPPSARAHGSRTGAQRAAPATRKPQVRS